MSLTNPNKIVTEERLSEFYQGILPYLGGASEAGFTPVGTVISVMGNSAPLHYLACNGQTVNIADYSELATYFEQQFGSKNYFGGDGTTTFAVPDLRGEFLRGTGTNSRTASDGSGNGANVGTHQAPTRIPWLYGGYKDSRNIVYFADDTSDNNLRNVDSDGIATDKSTGAVIFEGATIGAGVKWNTNSWAVGMRKTATIRPNNTSVLYCIATKNIYLNPSLDYSTYEKVVGTWIDGKPLYQKTIAVTVPTTTADYTVVTSDNIRVANNASLKHYDGYYIYIDGSSRNNINMFDRYFAVPSDTRVMYTMLISGGDEDMFRIRNNRIAANGLQGYVTIQYTKTTD